MPVDYAAQAKALRALRKAVEDCRKAKILICPQNREDQPCLTVESTRFSIDCFSIVVAEDFDDTIAYLQKQ